MKGFDIGYHARVMFTGFLNAVYGALTAGLVGLSIYGFYAIPSEGGYFAVCEFLLAIATMLIALSCMYKWGKGICKKSKHEKGGMRMSASK